MNDIGLPASILLYLAGATAVTNIVVNGIRNSVVLPAIVAFLLACILGIAFVLLFMVANGVILNLQLEAGAIIGGIMVGGGSAGVNAIHNNTLPTTQKTP
jgi:hypothetical protein